MTHAEHSRKSKNKYKKTDGKIGIVFKNHLN